MTGDTCARTTAAAAAAARGGRRTTLRAKKRSKFRRGLTAEPPRRGKNDHSASRCSAAQHSTQALGLQFAGATLLSVDHGGVLRVLPPLSLSFCVSAWTKKRREWAQEQGGPRPRGRQRQSLRRAKAYAAPTPDIREWRARAACPAKHMPRPCHAQMRLRSQPLHGHASPPCTQHTPSMPRTPSFVPPTHPHPACVPVPHPACLPCLATCHAWPPCPWARAMLRERLSQHPHAPPHARPPCHAEDAFVVSHAPIILHACPCPILHPQVGGTSAEAYRMHRQAAMRRVPPLHAPTQGSSLDACPPPARALPCTAHAPTNNQLRGARVPSARTHTAMHCHALPHGSSIMCTLCLHARSHVALGGTFR